MIRLTDFIKYPRTPHLPWSPGRGHNDVHLSSDSIFEGKKVVVTEKMDGENTSIYKNGIHFRSLDDKNYHPSRTWVKKLQAETGYKLPAGFRVCGENLYALHSLRYNNLPTYFMVHSMWAGTKCLSWDETVRWSIKLDLTLVPWLYMGPYDRKAIERLYVDTDISEGYVVRNWNSFHYEDFDKNVAKWVRKDHIQTSRHWKQAPVVPNKLSPSLN